MSVVQNLLKSQEPMVRLKTYRKILGYDYEDPEKKKLLKILKKHLKSLNSYSHMYHWMKNLENFTCIRNGKEFIGF